MAASPTDQKLISKLTEIILDNLEDEGFGVKELVRKSGLSRYTLGRKLQRISKKTVNQFIREVRLQRAMEILLNESFSASEVAYKVGFNSPAYFNKCFHAFFGFPPGKAKDSGSVSPESSNLYQPDARLKQHEPLRRSFSLTLPAVLFLTVLIVLVVFRFYPGILKRNTPGDLRSSEAKLTIAVMPFQNMTHDTSWNIWQDGIQEILISYLSNAPELRIRQKETIKSLLQAKGYSEFSTISPAVAGTISQKLGAGLLIYGSIIQGGSTLRINAQLINSKTKEVFNSFQVESSSGEENFLNIIDSLSAEIKNYLLIYKLKKENPIDADLLSPTRSPEAYIFYLYGNRAFSKMDWPTARTWFSRALAIDSNFIDAAIQLSAAYGNQGMVEPSVKWVLWLYNKKDSMPMVSKLWTSWAYAYNFEMPAEQIKYLKQLGEIDDQSLSVFYLIGLTYLLCHQYDKAIPEFEKTLEIWHNWDLKLTRISNYICLGQAYHETGQYKKEGILYRKMERDFPDNLLLIFRQAVLALSQGRKHAANRYINQYISISKKDSSSEADMALSLAVLHTEAEIPDKAEEYFQKALSLEPNDPDRMNHLAWFLIDKDRNIQEGMRLIDKALELNPEDFRYLDTRGWGLYKLGRYKEAWEALEKSWELKPAFNFELYLHREEIKKVMGNK